MNRITHRSRVLLQIGGYAGVVDPNSSKATEALLLNLVGDAVPAEELSGRQLVFPDATDPRDRARSIREYLPQTAIARWAGARIADSFLIGIEPERFEVYPRGVTLAQLNEATNDILRQSRRPVTVALPTLENETLYGLHRLPWVDNVNHVRGIQLRRSPGLLDNEDFASWVDGPALAPTSWVNDDGNGQAQLAIARSPLWASHGPSSARLTAADNNPGQLRQLLGGLGNELRGKTISAEFTGVADVANALRFGIDDGLTTSWSAFHVGASPAVPETLTVQHTVAAAATALTAIVDVAADGTFWALRALAQEGEAVLEQLRDHGSRSFERQPASTRDLDGLGVPMVELLRKEGRGSQLLVTSMAPYAEVSSDEVDLEAPDQLMLHGTIMKLADRDRDGEDSSIWDTRLSKHAPAYALLSDHQLQQPTPEPTRPRVVEGA